MTEKDRALQAIQKAAGRAAGAENALRVQRAALKDAVRQADGVGVSLSAIGRAIGVSRQRVKQMLDEKAPPSTDHLPGHAETERNTAGTSETVNG